MCICVFLLKCYMFLLKRVYVCISCSVASTLSNSMDCSSPGSSVHGILQVRILERVAIAFSKGPSRSRDWNWVSWIAGRFFTLWATREALICVNHTIYVLREQHQNMYIIKGETDHQPRLDAWDKCSGLVHWEDPEGGGGEGGGRGDRDGEYMQIHGWFMLMYGKNHYNIVK